METRLTSLEARFDTVLPTLATHTDISTLELKIAKVESRLGPAECPLAIRLPEFRLVDLLGLIVPAQFYGVRPHDFREIVENLVSIVVKS